MKTRLGKAIEKVRENNRAKNRDRTTYMERGSLSRTVRLVRHATCASVPIILAIR